MRGVLLIIALGLVGCATPSAKPDVGISPVSATARAARVVIPYTGERGPIIVQLDHTAIGSAVLTRQRDRWPRQILLRIHTAGLESIAITAGNLKLVASYSSHSGHSTIVSLWKSGVEEPPLTDQSPYWMKISALTDGGKPSTAIPLSDGYFEMQIPAALLEDQPETIALQWIDFFR